MRLAVIGSLTVLSLVAASPAQDLQRSLAYLPDSINAVAVVRVQDVLQSPRGRAEQWEKKKSGAFLAGGLEVNSSVKHVVRGLEFHPEDSNLTQAIGVVAFAKPVSMPQLAKQENGVVEKIAGKSAVHCPQRGYFVAFEPGLIGNMQPSYRQNVGRWIKGVAEKSIPVPGKRVMPTTISPYLLEVTSETSHVLLALDLADSVDPHVLRKRLTNFSLLVDQPPQQEALAKLLEHLRGIRLMLTVTENINGQISIDFDTKPSPKLAEYIRPLLIEVLARAGASIDELEIADSKVVDKSVVLSMNLSDASARHILSLAFSNGADLPGEDEPAVTESSTGTRTLAATKNYLTSVNRLIDDLQDKSQKSKNYQRTVAFHESYAKRIDQLSVRDVDPDVLQYAAGVSSKLRALAVSLKGVPLTINRLQNSITYDVSYTPWAAGVSIWGGVGYQPPNWQVNTNQGQIQAQQAEAIANGEQARNDVWSMIADERQALRLKLREKYNEDFE